MAETVWDRVDEPILRWVASLGSVMDSTPTQVHLELREPERFRDVADLTSRDVQRSLLRLRSHGLIDGTESAAMGNSTWSRLRVTAAGLIVLGEWHDLDRVATASSLHELLRALSERRDLPVLRALADTDDENILQGHLHLSADNESPLGLDLTIEEIYDAVLTLSDAGYVEGQLQHEGGRSVLLSRFQITGRGYQALGEWPLFDELASPQTLALLLERLADEAPTREEASNFRRAARYVGGLTASTLRSAAIGALAHVARVHFGLG